MCPNIKNEYIIELLEDIQKMATTLESFHINTSSIYGAISDIRNNSSEVEYTLKPMIFNFDNNLKYPKVKSHKDIENLELYFDMKVNMDFDSFKQDKDPFSDFLFNIKIFGNTTENPETQLVYTLHFDKHDGSISPMPHPSYHFQLGGRELKENITEYGQALFLDSPRIMHHPMELILSIDFILSNFFPLIWQKIRKSPDYFDILKKYQEQFIKPYFKSIVEHFDDNAVPSWNSIDICPQLIEN